MKLSRPATDYIFTYSGEAIYPPEVTADQIKLIDIAYGLAGINRYNGQTRVSVLRHSIAIAELSEAIARRPGYYSSNDGEVLYALMHDAAEAYVMDVPVPQKPFMSDAWRESYAKFESIIFEKYRVSTDDSIVCAVGSLDKQLVQYEMESRALHEAGSKIHYPNAITMDSRLVAQAERAYHWEIPNDALVPVFLQRACVLTGRRSYE